MGIVAGLAGAAAGASLASTAANVFGGGPSPNGSYGGNPGTYVPTAQPQADSLYQGVYNQLQPYASGLPGQLIPGYQQYSQNIQNDPYAGLATTGALTAANTGLYNVAPTNLQNAAQLTNYGTQALTSGFDPQNELYNRTQNQISQQAAAANAMSGVQGPYGASTIDQALQNFNIDWQNQQLGRQSTALNAARGAFGSASDLGNSAINTYGTSTALPSATYLGQQGNDISALNSQAAGVNAAFGPDQNLSNLLQSYLGLGQSATGLAQAGQGQGFRQNQALGSQFGQSLNQLGNLFSSSPSNTPGYGGGVSAGGYNSAYPDYGYSQTYDLGSSFPQQDFSAGFY